MFGKRRAPFILAAAAISVCTTGTALAEDVGPAFAVIDIQPAEAGITVAGKAFSLLPIEVEAEMLIERKGKSGTVSTRQGRALKLEPGTTENIAQTGVNFGADDTIAVTVLLKQAGVVVAESTATAGR
ncbi:hypothetical protein KEU06_22990 [Pseudaminobacter sp. 19-2017]|uniref:DUF5666 domain-containing protein n=1 Tax=Pseudaminobacter soli (ex Zhang et al. 2022) TaxID=2831468 RepID=A0A942E200_9HYPH|nr:curli-like amyloid fiber formation chaperone CsgH [Pseudaminobacter soli]MBS3651487.1 hypothetical protein [Pseudaminobacter soli]